jgi:hypothetical protein
MRLLIAGSHPASRALAVSHYDNVGISLEAMEAAGMQPALDTKCDIRLSHRP